MDQRAKQPPGRGRAKKESLPQDNPELSFDNPPAVSKKVIERHCFRAPPGSNTPSIVGPRGRGVRQVTSRVEARAFVALVGGCFLLQHCTAGYDPPQRPRSGVTSAAGGSEGIGGSSTGDAAGSADRGGWAGKFAQGSGGSGGAAGGSASDASTSDANGDQSLSPDGGSFGPAGPGVLMRSNDLKRTGTNPYE